MRRAFIIALALAVGGVASAQRGPNTVPFEQRRFDHDAHARAVAAKRGEPLTCDGECHSGPFSGGERRLRGRAAMRAEHGRCFGQCHAPSHTTRRCDDLPPVSAECITCHNPRDACLKPGLREAHAALKPSFTSAYSHRKHVMPGATGRQCAECHGELGDRTAPELPGHDFCGNCHASQFEPTMQNCAGCHLDTGAARPVTAPPRPPNPYSTEGAFDHRSHARKVSPDGRTCLKCHANIVEGEPGQPLAMPTMMGCYQSCHDGEQAFSAVGTTCTRCHQGKGATR